MWRRKTYNSEREEPCRGLYLLKPKGKGVLYQGKPQRSCLTFSLMGERESDKCWGEGHSRQRHVSVKLMLTFCKPQRAQDCQSPGVVRFRAKWQSWSWTSWQRGKSWNVSQIYLSNSHCKKKYVLEREILPPEWEMRWLMHSFMFLHSFALGLKRNNKTLAFTINYFKSVILPRQTSAEFV